MNMTPQQALAQYYQNNRQTGIPQATVNPTFSNLPTSGAPAPGGAPTQQQQQALQLLGGRQMPQGAQQFQNQLQLQQQQQGLNGYAQMYGALASNPNVQPMQQSGAVNALAQQMQANNALQRQIGYNGQPMPVTQGVAGQQPTNVSQMMQQFQAAHQQPQPAMPMQQRPGMASAVPQPMPGMSTGPAPVTQPMQGMWGGGLGTGAANSLARYYQR